MFLLYLVNILPGKQNAWKTDILYLKVISCVHIVFLRSLDTKKTEYSILRELDRSLGVSFQVQLHKIFFSSGKLNGNIMVCFLIWKDSTRFEKELHEAVIKFL